MTWPLEGVVAVLARISLTAALSLLALLSCVFFVVVVFLYSPRWASAVWGLRPLWRFR